MEHCTYWGWDGWTWEEAFNKFGFHDGDGLVFTDEVCLVLSDAGFDPVSQTLGLHNTVIISIKENGKELIPDDANVGYDDPRRYLPETIIDLLDSMLP